MANLAECCERLSQVMLMHKALDMGMESSFGIWRKVIARGFDKAKQCMQAAAGRTITKLAVQYVDDTTYKTSIVWADGSSNTWQFADAQADVSLIDHVTDTVADMVPDLLQPLSVETKDVITKLLTRVHVHVVWLNVEFPDGGYLAKAQKEVITTLTPVCAEWDTLVRGLGIPLQDRFELEWIAVLAVAYGGVLWNDKQTFRTTLATIFKEIGIPLLCAKCSTPTDAMCGRCLRKVYCSTGCQAADWHSHKLVCKKLR